MILAYPTGWIAFFCTYLRGRYIKYILFSLFPFSHSIHFFHFFHLVHSFCLVKVFEKHAYISTPIIIKFSTAPKAYAYPLCRMIRSSHHQSLLRLAPYHHQQSNHLHHPRHLSLYPIYHPWEEALPD